MSTPAPPKKPAPPSTPAAAVAKVMPAKPQEVVHETKEDTSFFDKNKVIIVVVLCVLILVASLTALFFVFEKNSLEKILAREKNKLRAAVISACKVDLAKAPKAVSFVWEEDAEGDDILVLKCEPLKKKE